METIQKPTAEQKRENEKTAVERKIRYEEESKKSSKLYHPVFTPFQKSYIKLQRGISFLCALLGIIILSPIYLALCIWIIADSGFPILFKQKRVAKSAEDGTYRYFTIYKFVPCIQILRRTCPLICWRIRMLLSRRPDIS